jgi:hypothetical protein
MTPGFNIIVGSSDDANHALNAKSEAAQASTSRRRQHGAQQRLDMDNEGLVFLYHLSPLKHELLTVLCAMT